MDSQVQASQTSQDELQAPRVASSEQDSTTIRPEMNFDASAEGTKSTWSPSVSEENEASEDQGPLDLPTYEYSLLCTANEIEDEDSIQKDHYENQEDQDVNIPDLPEELTYMADFDQQGIVSAAKVLVPEHDHFYQESEVQTPFCTGTGLDKALDSSQNMLWAAENESVAVPLPASSPVSPAPSELSILAAYDYGPVIDPLQSPTSATTDLPSSQEQVVGEDTSIPSCSEVELLKKALRTVIHERDQSIERIHTQNSIIRDFSLAVTTPRDDRTIGKIASNLNGQSWKLFGSTGGKGKKKSSHRRKEAASWHAGWLMGCRNPSLRVAESIWSKNSPIQALAQIDEVLHTLSGQLPAVVEDVVEAKLLSAAILRSVSNIRAFDLCEDALKICRDHGLPIPSRKAQFQRGLCFLFLESKYPEASLCFSLAEGIDKSHGEQLAFYQRTTNGPPEAASKLV